MSWPVATSYAFKYMIAAGTVANPALVYLPLWTAYMTVHELPRDPNVPSDTGVYLFGRSDPNSTPTPHYFITFPELPNSGESIPTTLTYVGTAFVDGVAQHVFEKPYRAP